MSYVPADVCWLNVEIEVRHAQQPEVEAEMNELNREVCFSKHTLQ